MKRPLETRLAKAGLWRDFHGRFIFTLSENLTAALEPRYVALTEERTYVAVENVSSRVIFPDVAVADADNGPAPLERGPATAGIAVAVPVERTVPLRHDVRERFVLLHTDAGELVAVIELLSPSNKQAGDHGRQLYLQKRNEVLESRVHLIEIDLLEEGERMPVAEAWPPCERSILVARGNRRPIVEIYPVAPGERLPIIRLPLSRPDPDFLLDVQAVFDQTWQRGRYERLLARTEGRRPAELK